MKAVVVAAALTLCPPIGSARAQVPKTLDIYFIDVEGGQATLVVTPAGETLLVDAGFPGSGGFAARAGDPVQARDPQRILTVAKRAGVERIDNLLVTHFHADHMGGVPELAQLLPIGTFIDHGGLTADADRVAGTSEVFAAYAEVRAKARHIKPAVGDRLPLAGVEATVVSSGGASLTTSLPGAAAGANAACVAPAIPAGEPTENPRSTGFVLQWGRFRFLNIGDLSGDPLFALTCPTDRIGPVDVYLVTHHGAGDAAHPSMFAAITPRVAVINNASAKGGSAATFRTLRAATGTDTWQLHRSAAAGGENFPEERIANLDETTAHWIKISASEDGSFTVTNARTDATVRYRAR